MTRKCGNRAKVLEHQSDTALFRRHEAAGRRDLDIADGDPAPVEPLDAGDHAQQRGLAAAGGAKQAHDLAGRDVEVKSPERRRFPAKLLETPESETPAAMVAAALRCLSQCDIAAGSALSSAVLVCPNNANTQRIVSKRPTACAAGLIVSSLTLS